MTSFRLAILNLTRRKIPSLIALIAIALSVAVSGTLLRLYLLSGSRFSTFGKGGDAIVGAKAGDIEILLGGLNLEGKYPGHLPFRLYESLRDQTTVHFEDGATSSPNFIKSVIPFLYFGKFKNFRVIGTDESFIKRPEPNDSLSFQSGNWSNEDKDVVIGASIAASEGIKTGDSITMQSWTGNSEGDQAPPPQDIPLRVAGVLNPTGTVWDRAVYGNIRLAHAVLTATLPPGQSIWGENVLNYFLIYLNPNGKKPLEDLVNKRTVGQVVSIEETKKHLEELTGTGRELGFLMTAMIMILGGLSVAAMMVTRFDAMTIQLAVLRAIGYEKREVTAWLLWEGFLLGISACVIGAIVDAIMFPVIRSMLGTALPTSELVSISILQSSPVWLTAITGTMLAVFIPLIRLYRQDIHFSLKGL